MTDTSESLLIEALDAYDHLCMKTGYQGDYDTAAVRAHLASKPQVDNADEGTRAGLETIAAGGDIRYKALKLQRDGYSKIIDSLESELAALRAAQPAAVTPHQFQSDEADTALLVAYTPTLYPGERPWYFNLTTLRNSGDVVLTVRAPHYPGKNNSGETSSVRFTRDMWEEFVKHLPEGTKMYEAIQFLDGQM